MNDFTPFKDTADSLLRKILGELPNLQLAGYKRVAFYSLGAAEGLLLDKVKPDWRTRYFAEKFYLEKHFGVLVKQVF